MTELFSLQKKFQDYLLNSSDDILNEIITTQEFSSSSRLSIYKNAYRSRLQKALATNYPVMKIYLGYEQFETLANAYLDCYPSHFRSIRWFGDQLENFLRENVPYKNFSYLAELAKVEWTMTLVFDAADCDRLTIESLQVVPPEYWMSMQFKTNPSLQMIDLAWNTVPIWQAILQDRVPAELVENKSSTCWIFWRNDLIHYYSSLTYDEGQAINAMLKGDSFGQICKLLCQNIDEENATIRIAEFLRGWISAGLITKIEYN